MKKELQRLQRTATPSEVLNPQLGLFTAENEHLLKYNHSKGSECYRELFLISRKLNYTINDFEVVFVGKKQSGKSSLVQTLIGISFYYGKTLRPFHFHLVNNPSVSEHRYVIKESKDVEIPFNNLTTELTSRNTKSKDPVVIQIEYKWGFDMTLIDTPGIKNFEEFKKYTSPPSGNRNRYIVLLEQSQQFKNMTLLPYLKRIDPSFSRSTVVLTEFNDFLHEQQHNKLDVQFHIKTGLNLPCYWITLLPEDLIRKCSTDMEMFKLKNWQLLERDKLDIKWYDIPHYEYLDRLGPFVIFSRILKQFTIEIAKHVPELSRKISDDISCNLEKENVLYAHIKNWNHKTIRSEASRYALHWIKNMDELIKGGSIGNPKLNGQTLCDEIESCDYQKDKFLVTTDALRSSNIRLYGAPQLLRLLESFKILASNLSIPDLSEFEYISSLDLSWTASEVAKEKIESQFIPVIHELLYRAFYILKRLNTMCTKITDDADLIIKQKSYPGYASHLRQSYINALSQIQQECLQKCLNELYNSDTIYWELTTGFGFMSISEDSNARRNKILELTTNLYNNMKSRIIDSIIRHVQTFFLTDEYLMMISQKVASSISTLSDLSLDELFDIPQTLAKNKHILLQYQNERKQLLGIQETFKKVIVPDVLNLMY